MRQYFVKQALQLNQTFEFDKEIAHHIKNVLRMNNNDEVRIVDVNSKVFLASLNISSQVSATIISELAENANEKQIICCAALIKKDKWELFLQKATELGATKVVPLITSRTIIQLEEKEITKKLERWNKITLEAAQQCNRSDLCEVCKPIKLNQIATYMSACNLVAYEKEENNYLYNVLQDSSVTFVIGPEGGLTNQEVDYLISAGFKTCSLGSRILRAETAGMYFLTLIDAKRNSL